MIYSMKLQNLNTKYILFWSTQKRQNLKFLGGRKFAQLTTLDPQFYQLYSANNTRYHIGFLHTR